MNRVVYICAFIFLVSCQFLGAEERSQKAPGILQAFSKEVSQLADAKANSVVGLEVFVNGRRRIQFLYKDEADNGEEYIAVRPQILSYEQKVGDGSGFIVSTDGYIVTNAHVVTPTRYGKEVIPSKIEVILYNGERYEAELVGKDLDSDIAVLKVDDVEGLQPISWANSDDIQVGEFALTIGSALGAKHTVGFGIISAVSRYQPTGSREALLGELDYIQTYAQINPGNSGGPLINMNGEVVGITSFIQIAPHSPGFAIPSNYAKRIVTALIQDGYVQRPSIGVAVSNTSGRFQDIFSMLSRREMGSTPADEHVMITEVKSNSPASDAGIREGDVVLRIGGKSIQSPIEFIKSIRTRPVGTEFELTIQRQTRKLGEDKVLNVKVRSKYL